MTTTISRRKLAKGAAWATPVIMASTAVPAYAASTCKPEGIGLNASGRGMYFRYPALAFYNKTLTFNGVGRNIESGEITVILNVPANDHYTMSGPDGWSIDSANRTATYIGPTASSLPPLVIKFQPQGLPDYQEVGREAWFEAYNKIDNPSSMQAGLQPLVTVKMGQLTDCYTYYGGPESISDNIVEIDYE